MADRGLELPLSRSLPFSRAGARHTMARRKVTMLEAFEASAREARQRERSELRRHADERRGVVGSLLSPFRAGEDPAAAGEDASHEDAFGPERSPTGVGAVPIDRRPSEGSSWEAPIVVPCEDASEQAVDDAGEEHPPESESTAAPMVADETSAPGSSPGLSGSDSFSVPMSRWSFAAMVSLALAAVFAVGLGLGGVLDEASDGQGDSSVRSAGLSFDSVVQPAAANTGSVPGSPEEGLSGEAPAVQEVVPTVGRKAFSPAELKFYDEATKFTVMAITYDDSPKNEILASEAYRLLTDHKLDALRPYRWQDRIFVFVGGAGSVGELADTLRGVKAIRDPETGAAEFRSAYVVNTADYR